MPHSNCWWWGQAWHRDDSHWLDHPLLLRSLSVVVYLTDVDESTHSFSIVPESLQAKQQLPGVGDPQTEENALEDSEYNQPDPNAAPGSPGGAVDVEGAAGTAIFFHTGNLHAGTVRQTPRHRHSIHLYYVSCWQHQCVPTPAARIHWEL